MTDKKEALFLFLSYLVEARVDERSLSSAQKNGKNEHMYISWLPEHYLKGSAKLGLTHIPGMPPGNRDEDLDALEAIGVTHIFCFVEGEELGWLEPEETIAERTHAVSQRGIRFFHRPIVDYEAPALEQARNIVQEIQEALTQGGTVILHCWAGLGRAGTLTACLLTALGEEPDQAIESVRAFREYAIQSEEQEDFIFTYAQT
ncbi:MAG: tyrosine-protein phosphatase [Myxococcales bacterium]|nr:tyrosine-protein phosphatase [Myxococcales bacterium]